VRWKWVGGGAWLGRAGSEWDAELGCGRWQPKMQRAFRSLENSARGNATPTPGVAVVRAVPRGPQVRGVLAISEAVRRAADAQGALLEYVRVDHRSSEIPVAEELLHGAYVGAVFEQVGGK